MSDAVHIEQGAPPWQPTPETTTQKLVLHRFTIPLAGVIEQHGVLFLYWCVTGHAAEENAWAYAHIDDDDVRNLQAADSSTFDQALREAVGENACAFAVASEGKGVIASVILSPPATFDTVHKRGMAEIGERFRELFDEYQNLRERFPLLESAARFNLFPSPAASPETV